MVRIGILLLCLGSWAQPVSAQEEPARIHFQVAASYYDQGEYRDALREFERAFAISSKPELYYNISLCYQNLDDFENAAVYLEKYLTEVAQVENRENLQLRLENFRRRASERAADGPIAASPPADSPAVSSPVSVPDAPPPPTVASETRPVGTTADDRGSGRRRLPTGALVSFIGAGVGVIVATIFGALALGEKSAIEDGCGADRSCTSGELSSLKTFALVSDLGLGTAVLGAGLGVVLWLTTGKSRERAQAALHVAPWMTPRGGGAAVEAHF